MDIKIQAFKRHCSGKNFKTGSRRVGAQGWQRLSGLCPQKGLRLWGHDQRSRLVEGFGRNSNNAVRSWSRVGSRSPLAPGPWGLWDTWRPCRVEARNLRLALPMQDSIVEEQATRLIDVSKNYSNFVFLLLILSSIQSITQITRTLSCKFTDWHFKKITDLGTYLPN